MRQLITIAVGCLLLNATLNLTLLAQETEVASTRKVVSQINPVYPALARNMNIEGTVKLQVTVLPNGTVKAVHALGGHPVLVQAAEDSVCKFRWVPAKEESTEVVELKFRLR